MSSSLNALSVAEMAAGYRSGQFSPVDVIFACLRRAHAVGDSFGAFASIHDEIAIAAAQSLAAELAGGRDRGPLHGIPIAVKENIDVRGLPVTAGSRVLRERRPDQDAEVVARLRTAGAIVIAMGVCHEFAWGITSQGSHPVRNPSDPTRVPGGSSGGSAIAVAAGVVPLALGTDTAGSVRIPAAFCGVFGIKPTRGLVPTAGLIPLAPSLDHAGFLGRTASDVRAALSLFEGPALAVRSPILDSPSLHGRRLAVSAKDVAQPDLSPAAASALEHTVAVFEDLGASVVDITLPTWERVRNIVDTIQQFEASWVHRRHLGTYPAQATDYQDDVRRRLEMSGAVTEDEYVAALRDQVLVTSDLRDSMRSCDIMIGPLAAGGPSTIKDPDHVLHFGRVVPLRDLVLPFTALHNLTGLPACSTPVGVDDHGLPLAVQLVGHPGEDGLLCEVAQTVAKHFWVPKRPARALEL